MNAEYSVVIPLHNEEGTVALLHQELLDVFTALGKPFELIYVNDGSTDGTLAALRTLTGATIIELTRRFGKARALTAGFRYASGTTIITIDGDCQNDPRDIPAMLAHLNANELDVVAGWRVNRKDRGGIRFITGAGRRLRKLFLDDTISDSGCALRVYRRPAVESLDLSGEMDRYIPALLAWKGFRVGEVPINDRPRVYGESKYGLDKAVRAFIDLIYLWFLHKYSQRPLHLFGYLSLTSFVLSFVAFAITLHDRFFLGIHLNRDGWFFLAFFLLIMAIMLFSFGVAIDLLMRIYHNTSVHEKRHYVREVHVR